MTDPSVQNRSGALVIVCLILGGVLAVQSLAFAWFMITYGRTAQDLSDTLEGLADIQIDAGLDDPAMTADDPLLRSRKILLFHDVNSRTAKDVSARLMHLDALDPKAPIDLYISTQGGWTDNAFTIIDTMRTMSAPVNAWAVGGCYSAGALILAAATGKRYATENTVLMIHTNLDDAEDSDSYERLIRERYERVYRERTSLPEEWYPMTDDESHYLSPRQALAFGLIDEVVPAWTNAVGTGASPRNGATAP
jgi:ATP-dependent Clp protease protease subunit